MAARKIRQIIKFRIFEVCSERTKLSQAIERPDLGAALSITVVTETYNLAEGQSWSRVVGSIDAAIAAATNFDDGTNDGSNQVLVIDASDDDRTERFIESRQTSTSVPLRHIHVPVDTPYDVIKDFSAAIVTTAVVVYLDGDCSPVGEPDRWLNSLYSTLISTAAPGVCGTTIYEGTSALSRACSALDFGFVLHNGDGILASYTSNNSMFLREFRANDPADVDGLRCACYLHAQQFLRDGNAMRHDRSIDALVSHERVGIWDERFRRGYDSVAVTWSDSTLFESKCFRRNRFVAATAGVARYMAGTFRLDTRVVVELQRYQRISRFKVAAAIALIPFLRVIDVLGIWRALFLGPDSRKRHHVSLEQLLK